MRFPKLNRAQLAAVVAAAAGVAILALVVLMLGPAVRGGRDAFADSRPPPGLAERFYPPENWAWGLIQVGDEPAQRYGVAAPAVVARADVLILPDDGESAETWFETARDLTGSGYAVWVLEGVGQGGSGRGAAARAPGADVAGARVLIDQAIRPSARRPLVLLGEGAGAFTAARAVEAGADPAALILSSPACDGAAAPGADWRRDGPDDFASHRTHDPWRGAVTHAWQLVNPDLRPGGPSGGAGAALAASRSAAAARVAQIALPTLLVEAAGARRCVAPQSARVQDIAGADPALELEDDVRRGPWLAAVRAVVAAAAAGADPAESGLTPAPPRR